MKTIKEAADLFGVTTRTIRYYEELGLLSPERSSGNQRLYTSSDLAKLKLIFRGKKFGFSLEEIKEMVLLFDKDRTGRQQLKRTIEYGTIKMEEIEEQIKELQEMKEEVQFFRNQFLDKLKNMPD